MSKHKSGFVIAKIWNHEINGSDDQILQGAVHKVRHARVGEGGPRRCDSLWQGEGGQEHVTSRLYKFLSYIWNMKFKVMFNFLV